MKRKRAEAKITHPPGVIRESEGVPEPDMLDRETSKSIDAAFERHAVKTAPEKRAKLYGILRAERQMFGLDDW